MTLNTTYKPAVAQGNGIIKEFSYSFNPISSSYIRVYFEIDGKWVEQKTGWSATVSDNGGVVTFLEAPNTRVSIERDVPESQPTSYTTSSGFQASVIEHSFDLLTGMVQELKDASDRSVKVEIGDNQTPEELLQTVYDKLDSATEIAGDAISAANQAQTAADNATAAVTSAEQTLVQTQAYVDSAKVEIDNTKNTAINTINSTVAQAKADVNSAIDEATTNISDTSTSAINTINTAVSTAESNISTIVSDAEGSITNIAVTEANKAIANAAQEATDTATANLNSYVDGTVKPSLQAYVNQAQEDANSAATSMEQAALSATAASNYASNASADADNAAESAGLAANSATQAKGYAQDAATSASLAQIENKISNCITKISQDIKLEINNGTLTLKAGSKVYVPNGKNADGSNKFDEVVIESDVNWISSTTSGSRFGFYTGSNIAGIVSNYTYSGNTSIMNNTTAATYARFYNTETNKIYIGDSNGGNWVEVNNSLPICIFENNSSGTVTSIDQVFNGFGYIGSHWYYTKGVSGRDMYGRNADGSLNGTVHTASSLGVFQVGVGTAKYCLFTDLHGNIRNSNSNSTFWQDDKPTIPTGNYGVWISQRDNFIRYTNDKGVTWNPANWIYCGWYEVVDGKITNFEMKQPIKLPDEQDVALLNGNNNYTGFNNYTQPITVDTNSVNFVAQNSLIEEGVTPSANVYCGHDFRGKNGARLAWFGVGYQANGNKQLQVHRLDSSIQAFNVQSYPVTFVNTPSTGANSYEAINGAWFNTKIQVVSTLPASPNANVYYFIPE